MDLVTIRGNGSYKIKGAIISMNGKQCSIGLHEEMTDSDRLPYGGVEKRRNAGPPAVTAKFHAWPPPVEEPPEMWCWVEEVEGGHVCVRVPPESPKLPPVCRKCINCISASPCTTF